MEITDDIIIQILEGNITEENLNALKTWLCASEKHRQHFYSLRETWNVIAGPSISNEEAKIAWKHIQSFIRKKRRTHILRIATRYAALVLILSSISFLLQRISKHKETNFIPQETTILPGSSRAILTVASGAKIELNPDESKRIDVGCQDIAVNGKDGLIYNELSPRDTLEYNSVYTPLGGEYTVELSDGTKVYMNSGSTLRYPIAFNDSIRKVYFSGEAYFDVRTDSVRPFIVHVNAVELKVHGTSFNINSFSTIRTVLISGSIGILGKDRHEHLLKPSQLIEYNQDGELLRHEEVDTSAYLAWKNGYFFFDNENLEEVLAALGRWYDVEFTCAELDPRTMHFTGHIEKYNDINVILNAIEKIVHVRFKIADRIITVKKKEEVYEEPPYK